MEPQTCPSHRNDCVPNHSAGGGECDRADSAAPGTRLSQCSLSWGMRNQLHPELTALVPQVLGMLHSNTGQL